jgi:hypothetical protein
MSLESKYGENKEWPAKLHRQKHDRESCAGNLKTNGNEKKKYPKTMFPADGIVSFTVRN